MNRITLEPGKRGGDPCIRSLSISVYDVLSMLSRSLGGRRNVGCKLTAAVYFSPISCQISGYSAAKSSKTIPSLGPIFAQTPSAALAPGIPGNERRTP